MVRWWLDWGGATGCLCRLGGSRHGVVTIGPTSGIWGRGRRAVDRDLKRFEGFEGMGSGVGEVGIG